MGGARRQSALSPPAHMKLLTHNMLMSPGTRDGFPLGIEVEKMEEVEAEFNAEFMVRMVDKIDYGALLKTVASVGCPSSFTFLACSAAPAHLVVALLALHRLVSSARSSRLRLRCHPQCQTNMLRMSHF